VEVVEVPKILPNGQVTFEADARALGAAAGIQAPEDAAAAIGLPAGAEHPADGTMSPDVGNDGPGEAEPVTGAPVVVPVPDAAPVPEPPVVHVPPRPPRRSPPGA
jgi:hypothetical protein